MPNIRPVSDLRNHFAEITHEVQASKEPVFLTKNGVGSLVVMSMEAYEELMENAAIDASIAEAEAEYNLNGQKIDARSALDSLRRKHSG